MAFEGATAADRDRAPTIEPIPALDGLRGVAVAGVLAFHAGLLPGGYLGVDLFFVLSGFLITSLLVAEHAREGRIRLGAFWARRARRLIPALFTALALAGLHAATLARPDELARIRADALASLIYVTNWRAVVVGNEYWALFRAPSPLEHLWSLAIEGATSGRTWSMRFADVAHMRRPMHDWQNPRPLQLKLTRRLSLHRAHHSRAKPRQSRPQSRKASSSFFACLGMRSPVAPSSMAV